MRFQRIVDPEGSLRYYGVRIGSWVFSAVFHRDWFPAPDCQADTGGYSTIPSDSLGSGSNLNDIDRGLRRPKYEVVAEDEGEDPDYGF